MEPWTINIKYCSSNIILNILDYTPSSMFQHQAWYDLLVHLWHLTGTFAVKKPKIYFNPEDRLPFCKRDTCFRMKSFTGDLFRSWHSRFNLIRNYLWIGPTMLHFIYFIAYLSSSFVLETFQLRPSVIVSINAHIYSTWLWRNILHTCTCTMGDLN